MLCEAKKQIKVNKIIGVYLITYRYIDVSMCITDSHQFQYNTTVAACGKIVFTFGL